MCRRRATIPSASMVAEGFSSRGGGLRPRPDLPLPAALLLIKSLGTLTDFPTEAQVNQHCSPATTPWVTSRPACTISGTASDCECDPKQAMRSPKEGRNDGKAGREGCDRDGRGAWPRTCLRKAARRIGCEGRGS